MLVCASPALDLLVQSAAHQTDSSVANDEDKDVPEVATKASKCRIVEKVRFRLKMTILVVRSCKLVTEGSLW